MGLIVPNISRRGGLLGVENIRQNMENTYMSDFLVLGPDLKNVDRNLDLKLVDTTRMKLNFL